MRTLESWPPIRPLKLHCTRHTWATMALAAGKSVRWVADQLGHADPALTLRVYAHAMPQEEADLSFAEFGGFGPPYTAPLSDEDVSESRNSLENLARREGLEPPTLRFEAQRCLLAKLAKSRAVSRMLKNPLSNHR